ncbi:MAG: dihydropteroate synthase [Paramuribaculum sp.]|nr:dihydropteroate synthase [Paramuribaculum sp.]
MHLCQFTPFSLRLGDRLVCYSRPVVMGIVNATPDSFYAGSRTRGSDAVKCRVEAMVAAGSDMLDVGAYSSRPGADDVAPQEEIDRLGEAMSALRSVAPDIPVSVDTFRAGVARAAVTSMGADIINDIAAGDLDPEMFDTVAELQVPYIAMHMRGTPSTMQTLTEYPEQGVAATVAAELSPKLRRLALMGVADVIVDPGFGFAKTVEQNYELMDSLGDLGLLVERPLLVGISRKSMMTRLFGITASEALPATSALNMAALLQGASIIRVHDVAEAVQVREMAGRLSREPLTCITETPRK